MRIVRQTVVLVLIVSVTVTHFTRSVEYWQHRNLIAKKNVATPRNPRLFLHHNDQVGEECRLKLLERLWKLLKGVPGSQMGTWVKQAGRSPSEFFLLAHRTHPNGQTVLFMDRSVINRV
jgi:hypothetical protein